MLNKTLTIVAAMGRNNGIGLKGAMPWHIPAELQHFKRTTLGKTVVMGRKTWDSIGRALPGRQNLVVSRNTAFQAEGAQVVSSLVEAIESAETTEVMLIGGGQLYRQALSLASRMVLTRVDLEPVADTWFPQWDPAEWVLVNAEQFAPSEDGKPGFEINEWQRR